MWRKVSINSRNVSGYDIAAAPWSEMNWLEPFADELNCYVTTVGRRTGRPHEIEIWFGLLNNRLYLISGNGTTADWYQNLVADPNVSVRIADETHLGTARVVDDPDERQLVGVLMGQKYIWDGDPDIGLTYRAWCFDVPAVAVAF